jgi:hypothetical protein
MAKAARKNITPAKRARPDPIAAPKSATKAEPAKPSIYGELTAAQQQQVDREEAAARPYRARAFGQLENHVYGLTLAAQLAAAQVDRAVTEFESLSGRRDLLEADLAIHAVNNVLDRAQALGGRWIELHNEACEVGRTAAYKGT